MTKGTKSQGSGPRMLSLLRCIASGERDFALKDLAQRSGLPPSTVHRLLEAWVEADLLERAGPKAYRMGPELFRLASLVTEKFELNRIARPTLERLWRTWQETASFCLLNSASRTMTVTDSIPSPHPLKYDMAVHSVIPLGWGSLSRAILAHLPQADIDAVLAADMRGPLSGKPLPPRAEMERELNRIRVRGYALYEDPIIGIAGVSAPVLQADVGVIGSLGVIMPASRFGRSVKARLPAAVLESARALSAMLIFH